MYWYTINYAVGSVLSFLLGLFVLYRGETRELTRKIWFFLCVFISIWHAGHFLMEIAQSKSVAQWAIYPIYISAILIPPGYLHFILSLLGEERKHRALLIVSYIFAVVQLALLASVSRILTMPSTSSLASSGDTLGIDGRAKLKRSLTSPQIRSTSFSARD